jgi:Ni,Fe-hydrogenase maturation factor
MKTFYVFGNPLVREDSIPLRIIEKLRKEFPSFEFLEFDTTEDIEPQKELNIIDTVKGIRKVEIIEDLDRIVNDKIYSMHDFDLGYNLKIWKKMGMVESVRIFGIPDSMEEKEAFSELRLKIANIFKS